MSKADLSKQNKLEVSGTEIFPLMLELSVYVLFRGQL